jgi:hypothetical protein
MLLHRNTPCAEYPLPICALGNPLERQDSGRKPFATGLPLGEDLRSSKCFTPTVARRSIPHCAAVTALSSHPEGDVTTVSADDCEECKKDDLSVARKNQGIADESCLFAGWRAHRCLPARVGPVNNSGLVALAQLGQCCLDTCRVAFDEAAAQTDPPWVAAGNPLPDVEGFRRSHQLAQEAHAVAIASGANARRVTTASDPGLAAAALMGSNLDTARVWVAEVLGPLASCTENDERLRETLGVFLRTGGSFKAAAEELHLHSNSVKYRVQRAIDRRGRPISDDRLDVEVALLLCHWYGSGVLHDE